MIEYIIIQAGGKGTRMGQLTHNKPKGIVPVNNLPIIFHIMRQYPDRHFIIIGDYKIDVLDEYLEAFCDVDYLIVNAKEKGTCAGINMALEYVPENSPFLIIWSDLVLDSKLDIDSCTDGNYIGLSKDFECRWSFIDRKCVEIKSKETGIAGFFIFQDKGVLKNLPESGELVRWFSEHENQLLFSEFSLERTKEIGTLLAYDSNNTEYTCRPFNSIDVDGNILIKRPLDDQGEKLAVRERAWYREVAKYGFKQIPKIYDYEPLRMQKIDGINIYKAKLTENEKRIVIDNLVESLKKLHDFKKTPANPISIMEAYYTKTIDRLSRVRDLIPFSDRYMISINGTDYKNPYMNKKKIRKKVRELLNNCGNFALIHGDCTFSNTMIDDNLNVIFFDPRGYFGKTEIYGDICYDWAKVYYSIIGNYDQFNNKRFVLDIKEDSVDLQIESSGWEGLGTYYLSLIGDELSERIRFIHAIIWLSLTTYAWEDYDSICGAFYKGTMLMSEFLED